LCQDSGSVLVLEQWLSNAFASSNGQPQPADCCGWQSVGNCSVAAEQCLATDSLKDPGALLAIL
jgi:hypothetical protein